MTACHFCNKPTREVRLVAWGEQESGPGWSQYAYLPCYDGPGPVPLRVDDVPLQ